MKRFANQTIPDFTMVKVTVLGAGGGIGQPLSLLLKLSPYVDELSLYDIRMAPGVAADLSHVNSKATVKGYEPKSKTDESQLEAALKGSDVVIIPAGVPRKPGMTRADLFKINSGIVKLLVAGVAKYAPEAAILVILNPVNLTVPIAAATLREHGVFNPEKLFGVTTLDLVRAETFLALLLKVHPDSVRGKITVIGGHSGDTIVPLVQSTLLGDKVLSFSKEKFAKYVNRVQFGGDEVVKAKQGAGSATLSMAFAGYRFAESLLRLLVGLPAEGGIPDPAFVYLPGLEGGKEVQNKVGVEFFAVPVVFGRGGRVRGVLNVLDGITPEEKKLVEVAVKGLSQKPKL